MASEDEGILPIPDRMIAEAEEPGDPSPYQRGWISACVELRRRITAILADSVIVKLTPKLLGDLETIDTKHADDWFFLGRPESGIGRALWDAWRVQYGRQLHDRCASCPSPCGCWYCPVEKRHMSDRSWGVKSEEASDGEQG